MQQRTADLSSAARSPELWKRHFEAALLECDQALLPGRLQDAKDAVMDRIEDLLDSAHTSERRLLLAALNTISELQRLAEIENLPRSSSVQTLGHAA